MERDISIETSPIRSKERKKIDFIISEYLSGNRTSLALVGEKGSGKTCLLEYFCNHHSYTDALTYLTVNAGTVSNTMHFFNELSSQLGYYPAAYKEWEAYANELFNYILISNKKYVLAIDDAHILASKDEKLLSYLRGKYQEIENILLFFTLDSEYEKNIFSYNKPFYGQLSIIYLKPLLTDESVKFIGWISRRKQMPDQLIEKIILYGGGNPLLLKMLSFLALGVNGTERNSNTETEDVIKEYLNSTIVSNLSPQLRAIIKILANNERVRVSDLSEQLNTKTGAVTSQLTRLIRKGLVEKVEVNGNVQYNLKENIRLLFSNSKK